MLDSVGLKDPYIRIISKSKIPFGRDAGGGGGGDRGGGEDIGISV